MTSGSHDESQVLVGDSNITESEIFSECTQISYNFADRLVSLISRLECNDEEDEEDSWFNFLKAIKKQIKSDEPQTIVVEVLKNWLRDNGRNEKDDDNLNDFLLEYYYSKKIEKKNKLKRQR